MQYFKFSKDLNSNVILNSFLNIKQHSCLVKDIKFITRLISNSLFPDFKKLMLSKLLPSETWSITFCQGFNPTKNNASFAALNRQLGPATRAKLFHSKLTYIFKV